MPTHSQPKKTNRQSSINPESRSAPRREQRPLRTRAIAAACVVVGLIALAAIFWLPGLKSLRAKLPGSEISVDTHEPSAAPYAGAHMTNVDAKKGAKVTDNTGNVATMTGVRTEGEASVTTSAPAGADPSKKVPPPN